MRRRNRLQQVNILGINVGHNAAGGPARDGGASLIVDGVLHGAIAEERLTRRKHDGGFAASSGFLLQRAGLHLAQVDLVVVSCYGEEPRLELFGDLGLSAAKRVEMIPSHHLSHAYAAFFPSSFEDALILVADNEGNVLGPRRHRELWKNAMERVTMYRGRGSNVELLERDMEEEDVVSLGELYGNFTRFIGFETYLNAGKTMALAAFGDPARFANVPLVERLPGGRLRCPLHNDYQNSSAEIGRHFAVHGHPLLSQRDPAAEPVSRLWEDLAATIQRQLEEGLLHKVRHWVEKTGVRSLCLSGGVALNCVANGRLLEEIPLERIHVDPNAGDQGQSLGNVLFGWHALLGRKEPLRQLNTVYWGGDYTRADCLVALRGKQEGLQYTVSEDILGDASKMLADGLVLGWFQGRSEWGPRALGNRSILADPRTARMRDHVNRNVKHRESFRPFAPVVPWQDAERYFHVRHACVSMTVVARAKPQAMDCIPAVVHVDGTARIQTVTEAENPLLHALLHRFADSSGTPILMNTSFNDRNEPIVETPEDALRTLETTKLDAVILHDLIVTRKPAADEPGTEIGLTIDAWMGKTLANESWFVEPRHHVPKCADAISVGILSHFTYAFSMVALGHLSLYHRINRDHACPGIADRVCVYEPIAGPNGELVSKLSLPRPLCTLERRIPLHELDLICVSLTNPDAVTTALNLLRLGGVPLSCRERQGGAYPLILAGGPGCCNPEPFADFFDFFCMGDGRTLTAQIVAIIHALQKQGGQATAKEVYSSPRSPSGLYMPSLYSFSYSGARITKIEARDATSAVASAVDPPEEWAQASLVSDGKTAVIVPNYGCKHRCAYCQISEIKYQQFGTDSLLARIDQYLDSGISTLIVNSATLTQHSEAQALLTGIAERIEARSSKVTVYIGSVRFDEISEDILIRLSRLEAFSHTYLLYTKGSSAKFMALAPEHGSRDLMRRLHRPVDPWRILDTVEMATREGVHHFVLYFIVGFESETAEDRDAIAALTAALLDKIHTHGGSVIMKINPLIPTPGTACQRMAMPSMDEYRRYLREVADGIIRRVGEDRYKRQVEVVPLPEKRLVMEAITNRADRRLGHFLRQLAAARAEGVEPDAATFKSWLEECGLSWDHLAAGRQKDEILPWQVVDRTSVLAEQQVLTAIRQRMAS